MAEGKQYLAEMSAAVLHHPRDGGGQRSGLGAANPDSTQHFLSCQCTCGKQHCQYYDDKRNVQQINKYFCFLLPSIVLPNYVYYYVKQQGLS